MGIDLYGWLFLIAFLVFLICVYAVTEIIKRRHLKLFKKMGSPGKHKFFDFKAYISVPAFIILRKHRSMNDRALSIFSDLALALFIIITVSRISTFLLPNLAG